MFLLPPAIVPQLMRRSMLGAHVTDPVVPDPAPRPARPRAARRRGAAVLVPAFSRRSS